MDDDTPLYLTPKGEEKARLLLAEHIMGMEEQRFEEMTQGRVPYGYISGSLLIQALFAHEAAMEEMESQDWRERQLDRIVSEWAGMQG